MSTVKTAAATRRTQHRLLLAAAVVMAVLIAALSLSSGAFKLLAFLVALVAPSVLNLLIAAYILTFISIPWKAIKYAVFVGLSFLLAIAVELPALWQRILHPPIVDQVVIHPVRPSDSIWIDWNNFKPGGSFVPATPLESRIVLRLIDLDSPAWEYAEGYMGRLLYEVNITTGRSVGGPITPIFLRVRDRPSESDPHLVDITIEVHSDEDVTARLTERGIPRFQRDESRVSDRQLVNKHFVANIAALLSHWTFWSPLLGSFVAYYPEHEVRNFLKQAILPRE